MNDKFVIMPSFIGGISDFSSLRKGSSDISRTLPSGREIRYPPQSWVITYSTFVKSSTKIKQNPSHVIKRFHGF